MNKLSKLAVACVVLLSFASMSTTARGEGAEDGDTREQLVIIEDLAQPPAVLAAMHGQLAALEFEALRPLQGRLEGQGSLWAAPGGLSLDDAIAAVIVIPGVADALSAETGRRPGDPHEEVEGQEVFAGEAFIYFDSDQRQAAADALTQLGFTFDRDFRYINVEVWRFLPLEYSVIEATTTAKQVPGVLNANAVSVLYGDVPLPGDVTGDGIVNVLDMIIVRNLLGQDPLSGDNSKADVNLDGKINILDMIMVRNHLGDTLPGQ